jgi:hypothetical protein
LKIKKVEQSNTAMLKKRLSKLSKRSITVGVHRKDNKAYENGSTTAEVGFYQEFGTAKMPARMWLRIFKFLTEEKKKLFDLIKNEISENDKAEKTLNVVGGYQQFRIKSRIMANEVTPKTEKDGVTLIDTGQLVESIDYEVH